MPSRLRFAALALLIAFASPSHAAKVEVDLQLAMGADVSRSVDFQEATLQRQGYIRAFRHPTILGAIKRGALGRIAVMYFEWGGEENIRVVTKWMLISNEREIKAFADRLAADLPQSARRTGISGAIKFASAAIEANQFISTRKVIDLSGDGANNSGLPVTVARDHAVARGFTINGLPIVNRRETASGWQQVENLDLYYRDCVIGGPRAFHIVANDFKDFGRAIIRKLILEIADLTPERPLLHFAAAQKSPPCNIGEIRRRQRWGDHDDDWLMPPPQPAQPGSTRP